MYKLNMIVVCETFVAICSLFKKKGGNRQALHIIQTQRSIRGCIKPMIVQRFWHIRIQSVSYITQRDYKLYIHKVYAIVLKKSKYALLTYFCLKKR